MEPPQTLPPAYVSLIPRPVAAVQGRGFFALGAGAAITVRGGAGAVAVGDRLAGHLRPATGYALPVRARGRTTTGDVELVLDPALRVLGPEGYRLRVERDRVLLAAARPEGLFRGVQTLRQLLDPAIESTRVVRRQWRIRVGSLEDRARFAWRGAMLDVARHFFGPADVRRFIDLMALYKLNRLHLHLTDDQGWRLAIRSWPRLTTIGGRTEVGGGPGGFYTQREYADLVAYAAARFITVVPEIDLPGHTNAALASYARLGCNGKAPPPYTGIDVGFSSLCIRKELTYRFVADVLGEVAALTPGPYLHIGGDEALATDPDDYAYFIRRLRSIVRGLGKRLVGWEETARVDPDRSSIVQQWKDPDLARRAVTRGARLILSPAPYAYLDAKYDSGTRLGLSWAGTASVRDAYAWDPAALIVGVGEQDVLGVEAPLWSETTATAADQDFLAFPRLLGHAELGWSPRAGRSWREYRWRLAAHGERLDALGVGYHRAAGVPWRPRR